MQISFFGGAGEVGRSSFFLESETSTENLLLDCGVKLGEKIELPLIEEIVLSKIKNIVITHTHLDHIGALPYYFSNKRVQIYATKPTRDLLSVLLSDFQRLQKDDKKFSTRDVENILQKIKQVNYNQIVRLSSYNHNRKHQKQQTEMMSFALLEAGHILGSAMVLINPEVIVSPVLNNNDSNSVSINYNANSFLNYIQHSIKFKGKLLYTGDFNIAGSKIMNPCERNIEVENLIIESTYGGKEDIFPSQKEILKKFANSLSTTIKAGGIVMIPAFAVGRAQEILIILSDLMKSKAIPECPIYVDGMIKKANRIYRQNIIFARRELQLRILINEEDPFKSPYFYYSEKKDKSDIKPPAIIVTTSGMVAGGPIIKYLKLFADSPANKIIFIGYQAEGTNGRKILDGSKEILFEDQTIKISAQVEFHRFSGHPDRQSLLNFIKSISGLKRIFLVHGELKKSEELKAALSKKYEVIIPEIGQKYVI